MKNVVGNLYLQSLNIASNGIGSWLSRHSALVACTGTGRIAWQGQLTRGDHGLSTIMLEAVASQDTWI